MRSKLHFERTCSAEGLVIGIRAFIPLAAYGRLSKNKDPPFSSDPDREIGTLSTEGLLSLTHVL